MIADIFYPIFTLMITILACFIWKKKLSALHPRLQQGITLDTLESLQLPPRSPAAILFGFSKTQCTHIFSVLSPAWLKTGARWSDIVDVKFPQIAFFDIWVENVLSIRVLEWTVTILGWRIWGNIILQEKEWKN